MKYKQHDYKAAINDINKAIELDPNLSNYYRNRGLCKWELGDEEGACSDISFARELGFDEAEDDDLEMYCQRFK